MCIYSLSRPGRELGSTHPLGHASEGLATETKNLLKYCIAGASLASARSGSSVWGSPITGEALFSKGKSLGGLCSVLPIIFSTQGLMGKSRDMGSNLDSTTPVSQLPSLVAHRSKIDQRSSLP